MTATDDPYYRPDLALVHDRGYGSHAEACAPGILDLLAPVRAAGGVVLEVGCGSGLLSARLVAAGHRVIATDASPAMLDLARTRLGDTAEVRRLTLPDDPLPAADAVVGIGHPLNYLPDADAIDRALSSIAGALRPGGVLAVDLCDRSYGVAAVAAASHARRGDGWAIATTFSLPSPDRFVRDLTTFVEEADGRYRRSDERHVNVLVDTAAVPALLAPPGVDAEVRAAFGAEVLPPGLHVIVGRRR